jgi:hypothetical protein
VKWAVALALLAAGVARAEEAAPPVEEPVEAIVRRAVAAMERHPPKWVCKIFTQAEMTDLQGNVEDVYLVEAEQTHEGKRTEDRIVRATKNGKDITAEAQAKQKEALAKRKPKEDHEREVAVPLSEEGVSKYGFTLIRRDVLWKHPVWVVGVRAKERITTAGDGTAWIDADTGVLLKAELVPAKLDDHLYWLKFHMQFEAHAGGFAVPTLLKVEGAGHYLAIKKGFRSTIRWAGCR